MITTLPLLLASTALALPPTVQPDFRVRQHIAARYWTMTSSPVVPGLLPGARVNYDPLKREFIMGPSGSWENDPASLESRGLAPGTPGEHALTFYQSGPGEKKLFTDVALRFDARFSQHSDPLEVQVLFESSGGEFALAYLQPDAVNTSQYVSYAISVPAPIGSGESSYSISFLMSNLISGCFPARGDVFIRDVGIMAVTKPVNNLNCYQSTVWCVDALTDEQSFDVDVQACGDTFPQVATAWNNGFGDFSGDGHVTLKDFHNFMKGKQLGHRFYDLNHDGALDVLDEQIMGTRVASSCGAAYYAFPCSGLW